MTRTKSLSIDLEPEGVTRVLLHPGYVRTPMTGGAGLIDVATSVGGMLSVLETKPLNGRWYAFDGKVGGRRGWVGGWLGGWGVVSSGHGRNGFVAP